MVWNTARVFFKKSSVGLNTSHLFYEFRNCYLFQFFFRNFRFWAKVSPTRRNSIMKKLIFTFALTLALTVGIASPISSVAQTTKATKAKSNHVMQTNQDGPMCTPWAC